MISVDLVGLIKQGLADDRREPDGLLHASSDLVGSLRHTQLRYLGAPELERDFVSDVRLMTGTFWHRFLHDLLGKSGLPFMDEIDLTPWMPQGWSGTADWLFYEPEYEAFVLGDLKTSKGESMKYVEEGGMKEEHHHQLSAYWYALVEAGFPMVDEFFVLYLPMNASLQEPDIAPVVTTASPLDQEYLYGLMADRWRACVEAPPLDENFVPSELAPVQDRVQKLFWKKADAKWELKLVPHWSTDFCPFPNNYCDCSEQGETKIGEYQITPDHDGTKVVYVPRRGEEYAAIEPEVAPDDKEIRRRLKALRG